MASGSLRRKIGHFQEQRVPAYREWTFQLFHPGEGNSWGLAVDWFIMILIAANVAAVMLETVDPIKAVYRPVFRLFEIVSVTIFSIEYIARVWSGIEAQAEWHPLFDRIDFVSRPMMVVDLLAILPFYLTMAGLGLDLRFLRALRLIRFLRLLKLVRYSESMRAFGRAFREKKDELIVAMTANGILLVVASSLMYFAEQNVQPEAFGSIPETMWWGVVTLTTVGYGDVAPITPFGRVVGSIVAILGIGLFALPASIMASGFIEESSYDTRVCPDCGHTIDWEDDIGDATQHYDIGDRARIDITAESDLAYRFHGRHGRIVRVAESMNNHSKTSVIEYVLELDDSEETVGVQERDLRAPIKGESPAVTS